MALLWVPVLIPDYLETEIIRAPFEDVVLGGISGFALAFCAYMLYSVTRLGREREIIPRFQAATAAPEKA